MSVIGDAKTFGEAIRAARRHHRMTQRDLALLSATGERFIVDLEAGKPTCQLGRALAVAGALGLRLVLQDSQQDPTATNAVEDGGS